MMKIQYRKASVDGFNVFYREAGRSDAPVLRYFTDFPPRATCFAS